MPYAIDVITTSDRANLVSAWCHAMEDLAHCPGFVTAELFEMKRDIRNAHYDFVGVIEGDATVCESDAPIAEPALHTVERTLCRLEIRLDGTSDHCDGHSWMVNPFEITNAQIPEVLDMWDKAKDHMVAKEGFINARLFRARSETARYGLINVAHWRSAEFFMAALDDKAYVRHRERSMNYSLHPSLCSRVAAVFTTDVPAHPRSLASRAERVGP
ncbi:antibiotic biosynthesis monooxygenase family protein [Acidithiobacillus ferrivorans]|uniref:Antibiotic biosynthesis monooxygenase n=1 Tax=Acidithiobacillus ferrivorans TaxID=160808 RepID=A0A7T4WG82_9PROT|nr:antibiotic biosynthesis monooxygenase [Acidithiobacillus ferrivorans]QQD74037.1 antibiotic biosynthesis monooxygenase [Acidithiobacillus ferrivorans]